MSAAPAAQAKRNAILTPGWPAVFPTIVLTPSELAGASHCLTTIADGRLPSVTKRVTIENFWKPHEIAFALQPSTRGATALLHQVGSHRTVEACFYGETFTIRVQAYRDRHCGHDGRCIGTGKRFDGFLHRRGLTGGRACAADVEVVGEGASDQTPQDGPGLQGIHGARRTAAARDQTAQEGRGPELRGDTQAAGQRARDDKPQRSGARRTVRGAWRALAEAQDQGSQDAERCLRGHRALHLVHLRSGAGWFGGFGRVFAAAR